MGKMKRVRKRLKMRAPKPAPWAGQPNARELQLEKQIAEIEARYKGRTWDELPHAIATEYGRLHSELLMESQNRSGLTLIKITPNAAGDGATYDGRNFFRVAKAVQMMVDAGIPQANAVARALEDERWRQQQETDSDQGDGDQGKGLFGRIKNIFRPRIISVPTQQP